MALNIKNLDQFLKNEWVKSMPKDSSDEEMEFFQNSCRQIYFWLGNSFDQENFDKFFNDNKEEYDPSFLWTSIKDHYAASSLENCAAIATKLFGMCIEEERISDSIIEIQHQSKLLKATGQNLFEEKTMTCMCAFNLLRTMPSSLAFVKNNLYQELKLSKKVPTIESVLSEVKLSLARDQEVPVPDALVLHIGKHVRCKNGKHSPNASHSADKCFQLHPHLLKEFQECKNCEKIKKENKEEENDIDNTGHHPRVYCIQDSSGKVNIIREDHAILYSGAFHSLFKDSERFFSFTKTRAALQQADGTMIYAEGFGTAAITASDGSIVRLKNSLIVPSITTPSISLSPFLRKGCSLSGK
ncbi:hypothetical protein O181_004192 [Austropuccinia psidii MF-1]|uniref:Retrovirus-related Pol polyprotein from transposon TNT 1-94-like beta-barrel domain-containing protein n=1 Tax=Austropuccinia psidii MF-1 TaxID=1389203 RepID=A0A9Q3BGA4_9BASI|nr:hypothetical protein [Austropuccinia psidii MF-1]